MKKLFTYTLLSFLGLTAMAQQRAQSSFDYLNPYNLNKAFAGIDTCVEVFAQQKNQWIGVKGAPVNTSLQGHLQVANNLGLGIGVNNWNAGLLNAFDLSAALSKHIRLNETSKLSAAVNVGFYQFNFGTQNVIAFDNDNYLNQTASNGSGVYLDASLLYTTKNVNVGLSIPRMLATNPEFEIAQQATALNIETYFNAHASYTITLSSDKVLTPMLVYRSIPSAGNVIDALATLKLNANLGLTLGYRTNNGLLASAYYGFGKFKVGYAYDAGFQRLNGISGGSHEFLLAYKFCRAPKVKEPKPEPVAAVPTPAPAPVVNYFLMAQTTDTESKTAIKGTTLTLTNAATGASTTHQANENIPVTPGQNYTLKAEHPDYETLTQELSVDSATTQKQVTLELLHKKVILFAVVLDAETNQPIEGVDISFKNAQENYAATTDENGRFTQVLNEKSIGNKLDYEVVFSKKGYAPITVDLNAEVIEYGMIDLMKLMEKAGVKVSIALKPYTSGADIAKIINLLPVYYEVNSSEITPAAAAELEKIVKVMNENENMVVEVGSHTDCTGSATSNQSLSQKRANAAVAYIQAKITNPVRISGKGYGESSPISTCNCTQCTPEDHAKNRRTEFKILKM